MIRKFVLAALLFILPVSTANAAVLCTLSATGVAFGEVSGSALASTGAIVIACIGSGNTNYTVTLTTGLSGTYALRQMSNGGTGRLSYNLYSETTVSSIWGNGTGGSVVVSGKIRMQGPLAVVSLPVFARLPVQSAPGSGNYADTITATMTYDGPDATTSFQVTAHVSAHCTISATNLSFGTYDDVQLDGQSQVHLTCTDSTAWNVGLDGGRYPGGTVARRSMAGPGLAQLDYQLFSDPARTVVWGNTVGSDTVPGIGNGQSQTLTVYGRIPSGERVTQGGYEDTITATLTF